MSGLLLHIPIDSDHPLFVNGVRRRRWWQRGHRPVRYGIEVAMWTVLILTVAWAVMVAVRYAAMLANNPGASSYRVWNLNEDILMTVVWSGAVSIGLSYLLDFIIMALTVNSISGERAAHRWDLLQLTPLTGQSIVEALYSVNQLRVWRMTVIVVGTRFAVLLCLFLVPLVVIPMFTSDQLFEPFEGFWYNPINNIYIGLWLAVTSLVFVIEPLWRMRATTALAMAISAQFNRLVIAMSVAFLIMVGVWIFMAGAVGLEFWGLIRLIDWLYDQIGYSNSDDVIASMVITTGFCVMAATIYGGFWLLRRLSLRWTARRAIANREPWAVPPRVRRNPWWNFVRWWLPHGATWELSPLFAYKARRISWWHDLRSPRRRFNYVVLWVLALMIVLYIAGIFISGLFLRDVADPDAGRMVVRWMRNSIFVVALVGGGVMLVLLDIFTSLAAARSVYRQRVALDDDLLRLTFLTSAQIVEAYRSMARVRIWGMTTVVIGSGLSLLTLGLLNEANLWVRVGGFDELCRAPVLGGFSSEQELTGFACAHIYLMAIVYFMPSLVAILLAIFIVPIAKVRLVVAFTLAIVTRFNGAIRELLRALVLLVLLAAQAFLVWMVWLDGLPEWGILFGFIGLLLLFGFAAERGALALTQYFIWREQVRRRAHL